MKFFSSNILIYIIFLVSNVVYSIDTDEESIIRVQTSSHDINTIDLNYVTSTEITATCIYIAIYQNAPTTIRSVYKLDQSQRSRLSYPNRLDKIKFKNYTFEFDDDAILPSVNVEFIYIYTCIHYNPVLLFMYGESRDYYYLLDKNTNKWTNHKLEFDGTLNELQDINGIYYYTMFISDDEQPSSGDKYEPVELIRDQCNGHCVNNISSDKKDGIKIYIK